MFTGGRGKAESLFRKLCFKLFSLFLGIRFCNRCDNHDGFKCLKPMKSCWKFNVMIKNRSCRTDHFYFSERYSGKWAIRERQEILLIEPTVPGVKVWRETGTLGEGGEIAILHT